MGTPEFIKELRTHIGHAELWLPGVTGVILRDEQVLLTRRADNGLYAPISGIIEPGEEPAAALMREAMEEAGVHISVELLAWVHVVGPVTYANSDQAVYLDLTFKCSHLGGDPVVSDDENSEVGWFPLSGLPEQMSPDSRQRIEVAVKATGPARFEI